MTRTFTVAVIGCGEMGSPIARRLLDKGISVQVCDPDPRRTDPLLMAGAELVDSPGACAARADRMLVLVNTEGQVRSVMAELSVLPKIRPVAIMSTLAPTVMREWTHWPGLVDAPISGGSAKAMDGTLTVMTGGSGPDVEAFHTVFTALATHVIHCGPLGAGQTVKLANNILCHANTILMAEALRFGQAEGVAIETLRQVMEVSTGRNYLTEQKCAAQRLYAGLIRDRTAFDAIIAILRKDVAAATQAEQERGQAGPGLSFLRVMMNSLGDETFEIWSNIATVEGRT